MRIKYIVVKRKYIVTYTEILVESFTCDNCGKWLFQHKTKCKCFDCRLDLCLECGMDRMHDSHQMILTRQAEKEYVTDSENCIICGMIFNVEDFAEIECLKCDLILCKECASTINLDNITGCKHDFNKK